MPLCSLVSLEYRVGSSNTVSFPKLQVAPGPFVGTSPAEGLSACPGEGAATYRPCCLGLPA